MPPPPILPPHIEETVRAIAQVHADHLKGASPSQRAAARLTALVAEPGFIAVITLFVAAWIGANLFAALLHRPVPDPPPFSGLSTAACLCALYITVLILSTQRRADKLTELREQLTLELSIIAEQKSAKLIELLEEIRRDNPLLPNRSDLVAEAMAKPADPTLVLEAIKDRHAEAEGEASPPTDDGAGPN